MRNEERGKDIQVGHGRCQVLGKAAIHADDNIDSLNINETIISFVK